MFWKSNPGASLGSRDHQPQRVLWPFSALHGQEHGIHAGQALHRNIPRGPRICGGNNAYPRLRFSAIATPSQRDRNSCSLSAVLPLFGIPLPSAPAGCFIFRTIVATLFTGNSVARKIYSCAITSAPRRILSMPGSVSSGLAIQDQHLHEVPDPYGDETEHDQAGTRAVVGVTRTKIATATHTNATPATGSSKRPRLAPPSLCPNRLRTREVEHDDRADQRG